MAVSSQSSLRAIKRDPGPADPIDQGGISRGEAYEEIRAAVLAHTGVDFTLYKDAALTPIAARRHRQTMARYAAALRSDPGEVEALTADWLIGNTGFFRNPGVFAALKRDVFPDWATRKQPGPVRIWSIGCSSGQEAYSIAIAFFEFCDGARSPVPAARIFASDVRADLVERARLGFYANLSGDVSAERLQRFFVEETGGHRVNAQLREACVFSRHNVLGDPPFSGMDLVSCRNLMMYLKPEPQRRLLATLHYALREDGCLLLGPSESAAAAPDLFAAIAGHPHLYRKTPGRAGTTKPNLSPRRSGAAAELKPGPAAAARADLDAEREADRITLNRYAPPGVLVDAELRIIQFRGQTARYLRPITGRATYHLLKMARPGLLAPLQAARQEADALRAPARRLNIALGEENRPERVDVTVTPLVHLRERYYLVTFEGPTDSANIPATPIAPRAEIASRREVPATRELAEAREYLRRLQEQHDATIHEVRTSSDQIQSSNEELLSLNEELETSKEELVASYEEIAALHEETARRNEDLRQANAALNNLHASLDLPVLVVGEDQKLRGFTAAAAKLFHLLPGDVGRPCATLRHELRPFDLAAVVRAVVSTRKSREAEVQDGDGRWYSWRARPAVNSAGAVDGAALVLFDVDRLRRADATTHAPAAAAAKHSPKAPPT